MFAPPPFLGLPRGCSAVLGRFGAWLLGSGCFLPGHTVEAESVRADFSSEF